MNIDISALQQGVGIPVLNVASRIIVLADILTLPTVPAIVIPATPGVLHIPVWFIALTRGGAAFTNVNAAAAVLWDYDGAGAFGGTGMTGAQNMSGSASWNPATSGVGGMNTAYFRDGAVGGGAAGLWTNRIGASVSISINNSVSGNLTGGAAMNQWACYIGYNSFNMPQMVLRA